MTKTITLKIKNKVTGAIDGVEVEAEVFNSLAVHASTDQRFGEHEYTITHIATGYRVFHVRTMAAGRRAVRRLMKLPVDWTFSDPAVVKAWPQSVMTEIGRIAREAKS